jgi:RNA polymerase sigma factor (sigma-70 family)
VVIADGERRGSTGPERPVVVSIEKLFAEHAEICRRVARRIVHDASLADDIVQEAFEAAILHPQRYDPDRGSVLTWLMTLTHHKAVDLVRWRQRHTRLDTTSDGLAAVIDPLPSPEEQASIAGEREAVIAGLANLAYDEREILVLAYFGGYSQSEIAGLKGLPLGTVKSRTRRSFRLMREQLDGLGPQHNETSPPM